MDDTAHRAAVHQHLMTVLSGKFDVPPAELKPDATLSALDLDSLARVELFLTLQEHWNIPLTDDDSSAELTLSQLADTLCTLIAATSPESP
ncbi:acyl carrier protein [Kitasatospora sp. McL0602]|uniref:acyl carrier protein n=1 Tax=Kitasatospora sp. McL0602 TaxID=3439530 RepID=UPI003F897033